MAELLPPSPSLQFPTQVGYCKTCPDLASAVAELLPASPSLKLPTQVSSCRIPPDLASGQAAAPQSQPVASQFPPRLVPEDAPDCLVLWPDQLELS